jgi:serine O-acetyltransferase
MDDKPKNDGGATSEPTTCTGDRLERHLCDVASRLRPLYSTAPSDRPDSLLHDSPDPPRVIEALRVLVDALFPGREQPLDLAPDELGVFLLRRLARAWRLLRPEVERAIPFRWKGAAAQLESPAPLPMDAAEEARRVLTEFFAQLPEIRRWLVEDVQAAYEGDPAALTYAEVQRAYPGLLAIAVHRIAHELYLRNVPIVPRVMSEWAHTRTGVDIHPGATIGRGVFIDHATGVVIGETARIGHRVKIYQGVTLGAQSFPLDEHGHPIKHVRRHPTVEDDAIIYANATILGGDTVVGRGSIIGANVFLMESVPPHSLVVSEHARLKVKNDPPERRAARGRR